MILVTLILGALGFFYFSAATPHLKGKAIYIIISLLLLGGSVLAIVANDNYHYGMKVTESKTTQKLVSTSDKLNILVYQKLGSAGKEKLFIYKTSPNQKKALTTKADLKVKSQVKTTTKDAYVEIKTEKYVYKNQLSRLFFSILGDNHRTKAKKYTFYTNREWLVLSAKQAQTLPVILQKQGDNLQRQIALDVKERLTETVKANPQLDKMQLAELQQAYIKEAQVSAIKKLLK
ncbi:DUF4811 domain-containing protein [Ligilactobacillus equi]